jgi:hypothetical protein
MHTGVATRKTDGPGHNGFAAGVQQRDKTQIRYQYRYNHRSKHGHMACCEVVPATAINNTALCHMAFLTSFVARYAPGLSPGLPCKIPVCTGQQVASPSHATPRLTNGKHTLPHQQVRGAAAQAERGEGARALAAAVCQGSGHGHLMHPHSTNEGPGAVCQVWWRTCHDHQHWKGRGHPQTSSH